ncbi:MAG: 3'-5' exonuclease [Chloroflexota bacterium]
MPRTPRPEVLVSVDVETSGPTPGTGSLLSLGACLVTDPAQTFYREIAPIDGLPWDRATERVHGLTRTHLAAAGVPPAAAMADFVAWVGVVAPAPARPVFVGFNAPFDWMFVADYLHRFAGVNPFGHGALDLKALYMGRHGVPRWAETTQEHVRRAHPVTERGTHHALDDARVQALLARSLLDRTGADDAG